MALVAIADITTVVLGVSYIVSTRKSCMTILIFLAMYADPSTLKHVPPPTRATMRNKRISRKKEKAEARDLNPN
jgi:hypothetical protein